MGRPRVRVAVVGGGLREQLGLVFHTAWNAYRHLGVFPGVSLHEFLRAWRGEGVRPEELAAIEAGWGQYQERVRGGDFAIPEPQPEPVAVA